MTFEQWFDPDKREHLEAFQKMRKTGEWPAGFSEGKRTPASTTRIIARLADLYCEKALADKEPSKEAFKNPADALVFDVIEHKKSKEKEG